MSALMDITELPRCANPKCDNDGMILLGSKFYCGDCIVKIQKKKEELDEQIVNEMFADE